MNEEEKKAIEDMNRFANGIDMSCVTARQMQIILNLIEKLQKENELAKKQVEYDKTHICTPQIIKLNYIPVQTVKDKIEEILNNGEYRIIFEGDAEFPDEVTCIDAQKYIKLEKLQELLEGRE